VKIFHEDGFCKSYISAVSVGYEFCATLYLINTYTNSMSFGYGDGNQLAAFDVFTLAKDRLAIQISFEFCCFSSVAQTLPGVEIQHSELKNCALSDSFIYCAGPLRKSAEIKKWNATIESKSVNNGRKKWIATKIK